MGREVTLRRARARNMLTIRALATAAGCSPHTVHEIESGRRVPRFATIRRLCAALGMEPSQITEFRQALLLERDEGSDA